MKKSPLINKLRKKYADGSFVDGDPDKPKSDTKYPNAKKVNEIPSAKEGWKLSGKDEQGRDVYSRFSKATEPLPDDNKTLPTKQPLPPQQLKPTTNPEQYKKDLIDQVKVGTAKPEDLLGRKAITPEFYNELKGYVPQQQQEHVYLEPQPKMAENDPFKGSIKAFNILPQNDANQKYLMVQPRDINGQVNRSLQYPIDPKTGMELDATKLGNVKSADELNDLSKFYTGRHVSDLRQFGVRSDATGQTMQPNRDAQGNLITTKNPTATELNPPEKLGTPKLGAVQSFAKGGSVGYKDGNFIMDNTYTPNPHNGPSPVTTAGMKKGGSVKKAPRKKYDTGGPISGNNMLDQNQGTDITNQTTGNINYNSNIPSSNDLGGATTTDKTGSNSFSGVKSGIVGGIGSMANKNTTTDPNNQGENIRANALSGVGKTGAIGSVIAGAAGIGDAIGKPIKNNAERTNDFGELKDPAAAKRNAMIGVMFSPSERLTYSGGLTDVTGKAYMKHLENQNQGKKDLAYNNVMNDRDRRNAGGMKNGGSVKKSPLMKNGGKVKGGKIEGPGTGTSDSIKADIKAKSFVVPAKNSEIAEVLREKLLGNDPDQKATLKQNGGTPVKLSDGEHLFTPEETKEIQQHLGDSFLNMLAPNAKHEHPAMKEGGLSPAKAKIILHEGVANGHPITDKQRRYFGWVSNKKDGGLTGYNEGGYLGYNEGGSLGYADGNIVDDNTDPGNVMSKIAAREAAKNAAMKKAPITKKQAAIIKSAAPTPDTVASRNITPTQISAALKTNNGTDLDTKQLATEAALNKVPIAEVPKYQSNSTSNKPSKSLWDSIGSGIEYGAAAGQVGLGLSDLTSTKRPIYTIDPTFEANVNKAQANAQFGFSPQQQFLLDQENKNELNDARFEARNLSGGNAGTAFNNERMAINDSYSRTLKNAIAGNQYQMEKQNIANNLLGTKMDINRQIFQDSMNAFNQKQQAGSALVGTGIQNIIGAKRYQDELDAEEKANNVRNGWLSNI